jgi:type II secretory ATPase GspE/PulE/Tfp pilus assembly ATPase PilB-like protein
MVLPLLTRGELTVVASPDPTRREFLEELEFLLHGRVIATLGDEDQISQTITAAYDRLRQGNWQQNDMAQEAVASDQNMVTDLLDRMELPGFGNVPATDSAISRINDHHETVREAPAASDADRTVLRLVNTMISEAASSGATDIHIEVPPDAAKVRIRFRKDGRLEPFLMLPHTLRAALLARLKTMANLDTLEYRRPQIGRIDFQKFSPQQLLHLRMHTIPTANGLEDVVLKLLSGATSSPALALDQLGLSADNLEGLHQAASLPRGMVLCVGPTGSGKATTLHALLAVLASPERKIWRAQASLDTFQPEVRQVQINPHIGWTFAAALRSFLQADADILVADELPDAETAQVAIEAALTGHMVLSTLPTHSAAEALRRLTDMGVSPFSLTDALQAVLAQKLVSRFCTSCRTSAPASPAAIDTLLGDYLAAFPEPRRPARQALLAQWTQHFGVNGALQTYHASGCSDCEGSGLSGRIGLHELMRVSPGLRRLIQTGAPSQALLHEAFEDGKFRTLRQDGISKVLAGLTSLDQVQAHTHG